MDIRTLKITQDHLRKPTQIEGMIRYVRQGGVFEMPLEIARFPDGEHYIHNGHHRAVALYFADRYFLESDEYYIKQWDYVDYDDIVFLNEDGSWRGYVTPFDVRTETRLPDFKAFKKHVKKLYWEQSPDHARHYILTHPEEYKQKKRFFSVEELAGTYASKEFGTALISADSYKEDRSY